MSEIFVGRQPIFDRYLKVFAYELLFRDGQVATADVGPAAADQATSEVLVHTVMDIGLQNLVGDRPAFVNLSRGFLAGDHPLPVTPDQVVLEVLEDVAPDPAVLRTLKVFSNAGYTIALDDFRFRSELKPLLEVADILKLDVLDLSDSELEKHARLAKVTGKRLLAEKVETHEQLRRCLDLGFDYFQGYFLCRPHVVSGRGMSSSRMAVFKLLARLQDADATPTEIEGLIAHDPTLSYRLLRYLNSASFALSHQIDSLRRAVMLLGVDTIRNWASLILLSRINDKPDELLAIGLVRAKMCELLAPTGLQSAAFTVGLLSVLDAMMDQPLADLVADIPLSEESKLALLSRSGPLGTLLAEVCAYETGNWGAGEAERCRPAYLEALSWSRESMGLLASAS